MLWRNAEAEFSITVPLLSLKLRLVPVRADFGRGGIGLRAEVAQHDQRLDVAGVLEGDAGFGGGLGAKNLVLGQFVETDELGTVEIEAVHPALALHGDQAVGARVVEGAAGARVRRSVPWR